MIECKYPERPSFAKVIRQHNANYGGVVAAQLFWTLCAGAQSEYDVGGSCFMVIF